MKLIKVVLGLSLICISSAAFADMSDDFHLSATTYDNTFARNKAAGMSGKLCENGTPDRDLLQKLKDNLITQIQFYEQKAVLDKKEEEQAIQKMIQVNQLEVTSKLIIPDRNTKTFFLKLKDGSLCNVEWFQVDRMQGTDKSWTFPLASGTCFSADSARTWRLVSLNPVCD